MPLEQTVFIVDDDPSVRQSLSALITSKGVKSNAYESAEQFIDSGDFNSPGCVVADVRMDGMTGFELFSLLRHKGIDMPVIVITGFAESLEKYNSPEFNGIRIFEKTCSAEELWNAIEEALAIQN